MTASAKPCDQLSEPIHFIAKGMLLSVGGISIALIARIALEILGIEMIEAALMMAIPVCCVALGALALTASVLDLIRN